MSAKPVILLITGAWHVPEHYSLISNRLRHLGYVVECPRLKTNNNANPPDTSVDEDIAQIRGLALQHLDQGNHLVAVMHSYGGIVGSNALSGLGSADRPGLTCVKDLIYICSFIPFEDESLAGIFGGALPPFLKPNSEGTIDVIDPGHHFYSDLSLKQQAKWTSRLVRHPTKAQFEAPKQQNLAAAWKHIPVTYFLCNGDQALPLSVQEMMVNRIEKAEAGLKVSKEYYEAGHSPFLSIPDRVVDVVISRVKLAV